MLDSMSSSSELKYNKVLEKELLLTYFESNQLKCNETMINFACIKMYVLNPHQRQPMLCHEE